MKKAVSWRKLDVTSAQVVREGFLEKLMLQLCPDCREES